jgi:hypothetical protein
MQTFSSPVNQRPDILTTHLNHLGINPPPRFDAIKAANDHSKLHVEVIILVLNLAVVWSNLYSLHASLYEFRSDLCFGFPNICTTEQKLAV